MNIVISIADHASPDLKVLISQFNDLKFFNEAAGEAVQEELRKHFAKKNRQPNKKKWDKTGFWEDIRTKTAMGPATADNAIVTIANPAINLKVYGGTVRPKEAKRLAIPLKQEAYGKSPRDFDGALQYLRTKRQKEFLVKEKENGELDFYYLLKKETKHRKDPDALPTDSFLTTAIIEAIEDALDYLEN